MRRFISYIVLGLFLITISTPLFAQEYLSKNIQNYFKEINVEDGLSHANVNAIARDSAGFIWIGTEYGLNRFDGISIKVFLSSKTDNSSLSNNLVYDVVTDRSGQIWVATLNGLNRYNHFSDNFETYRDSSTNNIYGDIDFDLADNRIWITANRGGLKYVDIKTNELINCPIDVVAIKVKVLDNKLLIGTHNTGLLVVDKENYQILDTIKSDLNSSIKAISVLENEIWVATSKHGIYKFSKNDYDNVTVFNKQNSDFKSDGALSLDEDRNGNLIIGTDGFGLLIYNKTKKTFTQIKKGPKENSIKSNAIRSVFSDSNNNIWLGTYATGVNMQPFQNRSISNFQNDFSTKNSLSNNFILGIEEGKKGELFIGTNRGGLNIIEGSEISHLDIPGTVVLSLCEDQFGRLWIGTYQHGLYLYDKEQLISYSAITNDTTFNSTSIWDINEGPNGNIWLGTTQLGLIKINKSNYKFTSFLSDDTDPNSISKNTLRTLFWDSQNLLWVGTIKGLSIYSAKDNKFINKESLKPLDEQLISDIIEIDSKIYIGTHGGGIYIYKKKQQLIDSLSKEKNGLVHNVIVGLTKDLNDNLWATTPNGVSMINTTTQEINNYSSSDGLIGNTFNPRSTNLLSSGYLALGSTRGLSIFHPDSIAFNRKKPPQTLLKSLKVLNEELSIDSSILYKPITFTESVVLPPDLNSISISYIGLHYDNPKKVIYKYLLEGFENEWRIAERTRTASYTNLTPGEYTFKVIASSGNNFWTENPASLKITILPHWWQTSVAKTIAALLLIGIPFLIIRIRTNSLSNQKSRLESQVKERTLKLEKAYEKLSAFNSQLETRVSERTLKLEKSNNELDRFVYSASHDLGAPLKSIVGLLSLAKMDKPKNAAIYINKVEVSIKKLEDVIQNLIQFSRNTRQKVKKELIDLKSTIEELKEDLIYTDSTETQNNISCTVEINDDFKLTTDPVRLKIILSNFISNSIKYRNEKEECKIHIRGYYLNRRPHISIEDNGIGIDSKYLAKIFDMFYRATTNSTGSGLGLYIVKESAEKINAKVSVESNLNEGSIFTIAFL